MPVICSHLFFAKNKIFSKKHSQRIYIDQVTTLSYQNSEKWSLRRGSNIFGKVISYELKGNEKWLINTRE